MSERWATDVELSLAVPHERLAEAHVQSVEQLYQALLVWREEEEEQGQEGREGDDNTAAGLYYPSHTAVQLHATANGHLEWVFDSAIYSMDTISLLHSRLTKLLAAGTSTKSVVVFDQPSIGAEEEMVSLPPGKLWARAEYVLRHRPHTPVLRTCTGRNLTAAQLWTDLGDLAVDLDEIDVLERLFAVLSPTPTRRPDEPTDLPQPQGSGNFSIGRLDEANVNKRGVFVEGGVAWTFGALCAAADVWVDVLQLKPGDHVAVAPGCMYTNATLQGIYLACLSVGAKLLLDSQRLRNAVLGGEVTVLVTDEEEWLELVDEVAEAEAAVVSGGEGATSALSRVALLSQGVLCTSLTAALDDTRPFSVAHLLCSDSVLGPIATMDSSNAFTSTFAGVEARLTSKGLLAFSGARVVLSSSKRKGSLPALLSSKSSKLPPPCAYSRNEFERQVSASKSRLRCTTRARVFVGDLDVTELVEAAESFGATSVNVYAASPAGFDVAPCALVVQVVPEVEDETVLLRKLRAVRYSNPALVPTFVSSFKSRSLQKRAANAPLSRPMLGNAAVISESFWTSIVAKAGACTDGVLDHPVAIARLRTLAKRHALFDLDVSQVIQFARTPAKMARALVMAEHLAPFPCVVPLNTAAWQHSARPGSSAGTKRSSVSSLTSRLGRQVMPPAIRRASHALPTTTETSFEPLFMVHGFGGLDSLSTLALHTSRPVFGIALTPDTYDSCSHGAEALADFYASSIRAAFPSPVFHIGGYSVGAIAACAIGSYLGPSLGELVLLDQAPHAFAGVSDDVMSARDRAILEEFAGLAGAGATEDLRKFLSGADFVDGPSSDALTAMSRITAHVHKENVSFLREHFSFPLLEVKVFKDYARKLAQQYPVKQKGANVSDAFLSPGPRVTLVRTQTIRREAEKAGLVTDENAHDLGLSVLLQGSGRQVRVVEMDTDHLGVVRDDPELLNKL
jgi:hypothetical protein